MKIAFIGYLHGAGGAERQIIMLANAMAEKGHDVHLIILVENKSQYKKSKNLKIYDLSEIELKKGNKIINRFLALKKVLRIIKPDISVHYWFQSVYFCAMMAKSITGRVIYSERGDPGDSEYRGLLGLVRRISLKKVDGFVFQSKGAQEYFNNTVINKSIVISNSVHKDIRKYKSPCLYREKKIVNIGRLDSQKNQKLLINSFAAVLEKYPDYILEIYGEGKLKEDLEKQIENLNLQNKVFLKGVVKGILNSIYNASLFILSSDFEGMPNALMEAMALGIPSISTDCRPGGAREIINNGEDGFIVPIQDEKLLKEKILWCLSHKKEIEEMANKAFVNMKRFEAERIFNQWERFFREQLKNVKD